ncbi:hypothetical protein BDN72DRAFT_837959 [Pluteus cervinus]|uniref:Uncharacterized protein n=1 Tax=Pluteus cervinus TaxID=181527 RepID=A0ACD3B1V1_9AGAR|nr:hypothetical protein BDN72DRAFT_837959 [Pluteus cervinus]
MSTTLPESDHPFPPDLTSTVWVSCTDNDFDFVASGLVAEADFDKLVMKTAGNQVTNQVLEHIKELEDNEDKEFVICVLGHSGCTALLGDPNDPLVPDTTIQDNALVQLGVLVGGLPERSTLASTTTSDSELSEVQFRAHPCRDSRKNPTSRPLRRKVLRGRHHIHRADFGNFEPFAFALEDDGNTGFWAWVLEADGLFHWVYIASRRQP